jgi:hypothetical protein
MIQAHNRIPDSTLLHFELRALELCLKLCPLKIVSFFGSFEFVQY